MADGKAENCKFCNEEKVKWIHYLHSEELPVEIKEQKHGLKIRLQSLGIKSNIKDIMNDINLVRLQHELRELGIKKLC